MSVANEANNLTGAAAAHLHEVRWSPARVMQKRARYPAPPAVSRAKGEAYSYGGCRPMARVHWVGHGACQLRACSLVRGGVWRRCVLPVDGLGHVA